MPKVAYDIFTLPIAEKLTLLNAKLLYDTSASPIQLKGWFEPSFKIGLKFDMDGQIYLDDGLTLGLFNSAIPPHPTSGGYGLLYMTLTKNALVSVWQGKTSSDYDTPIIVAVNKTIGALLVYNPSSNSVQVKHQTSVYPNYETSGTYSEGVVTLAQGRYALFYGSTKPTVNTSAPWGFTDQEPKSSTTKPSTYIDVTNDTLHHYYEQTLPTSVILHYSNGAILADVAGAKLSLGNIALCAVMFVRGGRNADLIYPRAYIGIGAAAFSYQNLWMHDVYDYDPYANTSWGSGQVVDNVSYIKDDGVTYVGRYVKHTTTPYNPRYSQITLWKYKVADANTINLKALSFYKTLVDVVAYGSVNSVIHPGIAFIDYATPTSFEYYNSTTGWAAATPGLDSYNYYDGFGIGAVIRNPLNDSETYKVRVLIRKHKPYASAPLKVGALKYSTNTSFGNLGVFQDYNGATIPSGTYIGYIAEGVIKLDGSTPTPSTELYSTDTADWTYLYGYPYSIGVSAPSSAYPGQQVTVTVTTDAPDGKHVYVVDKDTDAVLGSGTVSGGQAAVSFQMPNKNLNIRVYVEGADIALA